MSFPSSSDTNGTANGVTTGADDELESQVSNGENEASSSRSDTEDNSSSSIEQNRNVVATHPSGYGPSTGRPASASAPINGQTATSSSGYTSSDPMLQSASTMFGGAIQQQQAGTIPNANVPVPNQHILQNMMLANNNANYIPNQVPYNQFSFQPGQQPAPYPVMGITQGTPSVHQGMASSSNPQNPSVSGFASPPPGGFAPPQMNPSSLLTNNSAGSHNNAVLSDIVREVYPSYTNFSLVPTTATRFDLKPFLRGGEGDATSTTRGNDAARTTRPENNDDDDAPKKGPRKDMLFPNKLHKVLADQSLSDVIAWLPHGRSWMILDQSAFVERVGKDRFNQSKFPSFKRQVSGWGFQRKKQGPDRGSYYHELFLRGMPHLAQYMERRKRTTSPAGTKQKQQCLPGINKSEPDFYKISLTHPVPQTPQVQLQCQEAQEDTEEVKPLSDSSGIFAYDVHAATNFASTTAATTSGNTTPTQGGASASTEASAHEQRNCHGPSSTFTHPTTTSTGTSATTTSFLSQEAKNDRPWGIRQYTNNNGASTLYNRAKDHIQDAAYEQHRHQPPPLSHHDHRAQQGHGAIEPCQPPFRQSNETRVDTNMSGSFLWDRPLQQQYYHPRGPPMAPSPTGSEDQSNRHQTSQRKRARHNDHEAQSTAMHAVAAAETQQDASLSDFQVTSMPRSHSTSTTGSTPQHRHDTRGTNAQQEEHTVINIGMMNTTSAELEQGSSLLSWLGDLDSIFSDD